jgi:hypothetical protein
LLVLTGLGSAGRICAQDPPEQFRWVDFHAEKDQDTVVWVTRSLAAEKWTAIREIGVEYDAALVVTSFRATPNSPIDRDTFTLWNVSLVNHGITPLLTGVNLRWLDWMHFAANAPMEPTALYDNCRGCAVQTYFTAFHYDIRQHMWMARWVQGGQGVPLRSAKPPEGVVWTQVYAALSDPDGHDVLGSWVHFDYGKVKRPEDFVYRYDLDPFSNLERTEMLSGKEAETMKDRLCRAQSDLTGLASGQDSPLCASLQKPTAERKPVTTPPANNRGQSQPPGARH